MNYRYITLSPGAKQEVKKRMKQFQDDHPEIDLRACYSAILKIDRNIADKIFDISKEGLTTVEDLIYDMLDIPEGMPIEIYDAFSSYIDTKKSHFRVIFRLKDLTQMPFYEGQEINFILDEKEARRSDIPEIISLHKIDTVNGLEAEEFLKRRKAYIAAIREVKMTTNAKGLRVNELFKVACNPNYEINKNTLVKIAKDSLNRPLAPMELLVPPNSIKLVQETYYRYLKGSYFEDFTLPEIESITRYNLLETEKGLSIRFSSIPDRKLDEVLEVLRNKTNITLAIEGEDRQRILAKNLSFKGISVHYTCDLVTEALEDFIDRFDKQTEITVGAKDVNETTVSLTKYRVLLRELKKVVEGIPLNMPERYRFKEVYIRLGKMLKYDRKITKKNKNLESYQNENKRKSRNLVNALVKKECVCAGIAETLRQALGLVGITSKNCISQKHGGIAHEFNIVKIDGNWYNADLTWDLDSIKRGEYPIYSLKSDKEFENIHTKDPLEFHKKSEIEIKCPNSLELFLGLKIKKFLKGKLEKNLFLSQKESAQEIVASSQNEKQKRQAFLQTIKQRHTLDTAQVSTKENPNIMRKGKEKEEKGER